MQLAKIQYISRMKSTNFSPPRLVWQPEGYSKQPHWKPRELFLCSAQRHVNEGPAGQGTARPAVSGFQCFHVTDQVRGWRTYRRRLNDITDHRYMTKQLEEPNDCGNELRHSYRLIHVNKVSVRHL